MSTPTEASWRVFIAVDIGETVRRALAGIQAELRKTHPDIKWVAPDNIHLTLAFLGDIFPQQVGPLAARLDAAAGGLPPFSCEVQGLGTFGPPHSPRVIWAGITQGADAVIGLQKVIAQAVRDFGLKPEDRAFHPHLTLARIKFSRSARHLEERLAKLPSPSLGAFHVNTVQLMRSVLLPAGPAYTVIHPSRLQ
jgi:2'-5' RNA ligase